MRILCYGDSNTYGFDPRSYLGDRYPPEIRWPERVARETGWQVRNEGLNGREIPHRPGELERAASLALHGDWDAVVILLGGNDLLQGCSPEEAAARMEGLLTRLREVPVLLIAPPPMTRGTWVTEPRLVSDSRRYAVCCKALAERLGVWFADAGTWGIETVFDGVHFSEAGHRLFAEQLIKLFDQTFSRKSLRGPGAEPMVAARTP